MSRAGPNLAPIGTGAFTLTAAQQEALVPLALIRAHTKTDDIDYVTDDLIVLYREAAFELIAEYTDFQLDADGVMDQFVGYPQMGTVVDVALKAPSADGIIQVTADGTTYMLVVPIGATSVKVGSGQLDTKGYAVCCNPCSSSIQQGVSLRYVSTKSGRGLPAGVRMGVLMYCAWAIANPGDCGDSMKCATACGAFAMWRKYRSKIGF